MLSKRTHPMIGKLSELLVSVNRSNPFSEALTTTTSPRSPLDFKIFPQISPRNNARRFYDTNLGGVGLGIVAALENSTTRAPSICRFGRFPVPKPDPNRSGSDPVPITSSRRCVEDDDDEGLMDEDYTYVTCHHGPPGGSCTTTRVYRDGFECCASKNREPERSSLVFGDCFHEPPETSPELEGLDFLNACFLCRKKLHGLDIYMYRGEKAFCSAECRSIHITNDERKERCRSEYSTSPYTAGQIFSAGVLVI